MVTLRQSFLVAACFALIISFFAFNVNADDWNKATLITTNQPIEVPGRILPAGTYIFKLYDSLGNRQVVQILSDDQTKLYQTVLAIPDYRPEPAPAGITFYEMPGNRVGPVRSWFYEGQRTGIQFVYSKERAADLAKVTGENVPSADSAVTQEAAVTKAEPSPAVVEKPAVVPEAPVVQTESAPVAAPKQETQPESQIAALSPEPAIPAAEPVQTPASTSATPEAATPPKALPRTAGPDALFLLAGLSSAVAAFGVRRLRRS